MDIEGDIHRKEGFMLKEKLHSVREAVYTGFEALEFVNPFGKIKIDPRNIRNGFKVIGLEGRNMADRILLACEATIKNNKDYSRLESSIFGRGYDSSKQQITLMDLVDYLFGIENAKAALEFYKYDTEFIKVAQKIVAKIKDGVEMSSLEKYRGLYYMVVGGNTRTSTLILAYHEFKEQWESNGSLDFVVPATIVNYSYTEFLNQDGRFFNKNMKASDILNQRREYQLAYELMAFDDNAIRNNSQRSSMLAKATLARQMVDWYELSADATVKNAKRKIMAFKTMYKSTSLNETSLFEGLAYGLIDEVRECLKERDDSIEVGKTDFFNETESDSFANFCSKVISLIAGHVSDEVGSSKRSQAVGIDLEDMSNSDREKLIYLLKESAILREIDGFNGAASYFAKELTKETPKPNSKTSIANWIKKARKNACKNNTNASEGLDLVWERFCVMGHGKGGNPTGMMLINEKDFLEVKRMLRKLMKKGGN